jgi:predicted  nucleic acid-binding Zn-ribbon protein
MDRDEKLIRTVYQLEHLKEQFEDFVVSTSKSVVKTETRLEDMQKGIAKREAQMDAIDDKVSTLVTLMRDGGDESSRKGVVTQTLENSNKISRLEVEIKAWKRAAVLIGGLISGFLLAGKYLFNLIKLSIENEIN